MLVRTAKVCGIGVTICYLTPPIPLAPVKKLCCSQGLVPSTQSPVRLSSCGDGTGMLRQPHDGVSHPSPLALCREVGRVKRTYSPLSHPPPR